MTRGAERNTKKPEYRKKHVKQPRDLQYPQCKSLGFTGWKKATRKLVFTPRPTHTENITSTVVKRPNGSVVGCRKGQEATTPQRNEKTEAAHPARSSRRFVRFRGTATRRSTPTTVRNEKASHVTTPEDPGGRFTESAMLQGEIPCTERKPGPQ